MFLSVIVPPGLVVAGHTAAISAPLSGHHNQWADGQMAARATARPLRSARRGVTTTLDAPFFVRSADYAPSSGGHIEQRQHHTDDAGDDEDHADRWPRYARHVKCQAVADDRADGDEEDRRADRHT